MTVRVPSTPIFLRPELLIAASTAWMPCTSGSGEIGSSSLMQKWPPIEVTAAASAPAVLHAPDQAGEDRRLLGRGLFVEVARHLAHVGMGDGAFERNARRDMPVDQAAIVEVGGGRADAADQSDMHAPS